MSKAQQNSGLSPRLLSAPIGTSLLGIDVTFDWYARNPFRFLGLNALASEVQIKQKQQRFKNLYRLNPERAASNAIQVGYENKTDNFGLLDNIGTLNHATRRLVWEIFWVYLDTSTVNVFTKNQSLVNDEFVKAVENQTPELRDHDFAVIYHNQALAAEISGLTTESEIAWTTAHSYWAKTIYSTSFWDHIKNRIARLEDYRLNHNGLEQIQQELPKVVLAFNVMLAKRYLKLERIPDAARHLKILVTSPLDSEHCTPAVIDLLQQIVVDRLHPHMDKLKQQVPTDSDKAHWKRFVPTMPTLLADCEAIHQQIANEFGIDPKLLAQVHLDKIAETILDVINIEIDYQQDSAQSLLFSCLVAERLTILPLSESIRRKAEEVRDQDRKHLYKLFYEDSNSDLRQLDPTHCWFLPSEPADPEASILIPMYKIRTPKQVRDGQWNIPWSSAKMVIPRSNYTRACHEGRSNVQRTNREARDLETKLASLEAEAVRQQKAIEQQCRTKIADTEALHDETIKAFIHETKKERETLNTSIRSLEASFQQQLDDERSIVEQQQQSIRQHWAHQMFPVKDQIRQYGLRFRITTQLPIMFLGAIGAGLILHTPPLMSNALNLLVSLELKIRSQLHVPDALVMLLPFIGAAMLAMLSIFIVLELWRHLNLTLPRAHLRQLMRQEKKALDTVLNENKQRVDKILKEQELKVGPDKDRLSVLEERHQSLLAERKAAISHVQMQYQQQIEKELVPIRHRINKIKAQLDQLMLNPKPLSTKIKFPAYQVAIDSGFQEGDKPSEWEMNQALERHMRYY